MGALTIKDPADLLGLIATSSASGRRRASSASAAIMKSQRHPSPNNQVTRSFRRPVVSYLATGILAKEGIVIREGLYVNDTTYSPYDSQRGQLVAPSNQH